MHVEMFKHNSKLIENFFVSVRCTQYILFIFKTCHDYILKLILNIFKLVCEKILVLPMSYKLLSLLIFMLIFIISALDKIIIQGYKALQLQYFFTAGHDEVKAWTIQVS